MAASYTVVGSLVIAALNAASSYTITPSDPRYYTQQIKDAINNADGSIVDLILANPTHPRRDSFITSSAVAHLARVPTHPGTIEAVTVDGEGASIWPKVDIERERDNALALTFDKHYWIDASGTLYHNGTTATVSYPAYTRSSADPPVLQSPDEYTEAVACKALYFLFDVEGEDPQAAAHYGAICQQHAAAIAANRALPELNLYARNS